MKLPLALLAPLALSISTGCTPLVEGEPGEPKCDGRLQTSEDSIVDSPFDRDGDGYVDGSVPECVENYGADALDCDDTDFRMHPGALEIPCNGIDDDCNPDTPDALDHDGDGVSSCDDCDDDNPARHPGNQELCWDGLDNDCDDIVDNECGLDYNGYFALDQRIHEQCQAGLIALNFDEISVLWDPPYASLVSIDSALPGPLNGTIDEDGSFDLQGSTPVATGTCTIKFRWTGRFADQNSFTGDFEARFSGFFCTGCQNRTWTDVTGIRTGY